jgi:GDP-mannose 6-dehydrogenase
MQKININNLLEVSMKVSIFGLGYVGVVTAACLARDGHEVICVDVNPNKVNIINSGNSPIIEPGLEDLLVKGIKQNRIIATTDAQESVINTDVSLISVGTPSTQAGGVDLSFVFKVCAEIGSSIYQKGSPHVVVLRSTVQPGTLDYCSSLIKDRSKNIPVHFAFNPEFLREGSAIRDYNEPPYTVIGTKDIIAESTIRELYAKIMSPFIVVKPEVAEMLKCVSNAWHAVKISFANEIGRIAKEFRVDGREVMNMLVQDAKLNVSPAYMRPGFAYGGSCLPKDVGALIRYAQEKATPIPLLNSLPETNRIQVESAVQEVIRVKARRVTVLGLAFKPRTDDLRESPAVILVKRLLGEGCKVKIYDKPVYQATLMGSNLEYIQRNLPHFRELMMADPKLALKNSELVIVTYPEPEFRDLLLNISPEVSILDLAGLFNEPPEGVNYYGIGW